MTIPFGEDDLNFISSQLENSEDQFNNTGGTFTNGTTNFLNGFGIVTPVGSDDTNFGTFSSNNNFGTILPVENGGGEVTNTFLNNNFQDTVPTINGDITTRATGQEDERVRRIFTADTEQFDNTVGAGGITTIGTNGTINGITIDGTTGQQDEIIRFDTGLGTVPVLRTTAEIVCEPPGTFIGCTGDITVYGGIAEFSNGVQDGTCSRYTAISALCTPQEDTTTNVGITNTTTTTPQSGCPTGTTQCGPRLAAAFGQENDSALTCCSESDICCFNGTSYYCSATTCVGVSGGGRTEGRDPCNGCPAGFECRESNLGGFQCINPQQDPCLNNGPCGDPQYYRCAYIPGGSPTCIQIRPRLVWTSCETGTEVEGTPPTNLVQSTDVFGKLCYRQPTITYRLCNSVTTITGQPPEGLLELTDPIGVCYKQPDTWRQCGNPQRQAGTPPSTLGLTVDAFGECYDSVWISCDNPTINNRGTPPVNYDFDQSRSCWRERINTPTQCGGTTYGPCGIGQICIPITLPGQGITYICTTPPTPTPEPTPDPTPPPTATPTVDSCPCTDIGEYFGTTVTEACDGQNTIRLYRNACTDFIYTDRTCSPDTAFTGYTRSGISNTYNYHSNGAYQGNFACPVPNVTPTQPPPPPPTLPPISTPPIITPPIITPPVIIPTPTPTITIPATPTPTPPPTPRIVWRDCITGDLKEGLAPAGYREVAYQGAGGGTCWEPTTVVGFSPPLDAALYFVHQRGTGNYPQPKTITAANPSYGVSYDVKIVTNASIIVEPRAFILEPRKSIDFVVNVTPELIAQLGDGKSTISMTVEVKEL